MSSLDFSRPELSNNTSIKTFPAMATFPVPATPDAPARALLYYPCVIERKAEYENGADLACETTRKAMFRRLGAHIGNIATPAKMSCGSPIRYWKSCTMR